MQIEAGSSQRAHRTPVRSRARSRRIAGREQHRQLVGGQPLGAAFRGRGPPRETALGEPLVAKPKPLAIVGEHLQRRPFAIAEYEDRAGERILSKCFLAKPRQAIDASAKIGRLDGHQDPDKRGQLPKDLERARSRFQAWRGWRQAGGRIPRRLWALAVRLVNRHGVSRTAAVLGLDYYTLKDRAEGTAGHPSSSSPAFVELPSAVVVDLLESPPRQPTTS